MKKNLVTLHEENVISGSLKTDLLSFSSNITFIVCHHPPGISSNQAENLIEINKTGLEMPRAVITETQAPQSLLSSSSITKSPG